VETCKAYFSEEQLVYFSAFLQSYHCACLLVRDSGFT